MSNNLGNWRALEPAGRIALAIGLGWEGEPTVTEADDWIADVLKIRERNIAAGRV